MGCPAYTIHKLLSHYPNYSAISHWHDDIEFLMIRSGQIQYNVNGKILTLEQGQGIFVNSRQMHYGFSESHRECEFFCILIHPMLLCTLPAYKKVSKTLFYSKHSQRQCSHRQNDCCRQCDPFFIPHADTPLPTSSVRVCRIN